MRDIQHHLASTLSVELSVGTISRITDAVADAVLEWQRRPLEESSSRWSTTGAIRADGPRLFTGSPPAQPTSRSGRGMDGRQARGLSIWAPAPGREPPSRAARVRRAGQQGRQGRPDRRGGTSRTGAKCGGNATGPAGLPEAIEATWPQATVQTCVVHPVPCLWMRFVSYGDRKKVAAALKADLHRSAPGGRLAGSD